MFSNYGYLSSHFVVVQINRRSSVVSFFQVFKKAPRLVLSKLDVIATPSPSPAVLSPCMWKFPPFTLASPYVVSAFKRQLVSDGGSTDGMDECGLFRC